MGTENQNFFKWKQDSFFIQVVIQDATDLTSYKAHWAMALSATHSPVLVKTTTGHFGQQGGITWSSPNTARIQINESDTQEIAINKYYHELTIEDSSGNSVVVATGTFDLRQAIFSYR